jgi:hypothetical protein
MRALPDPSPADAQPEIFPLSSGVTVVGSGVDADIRLSDLAPHHGEVRYRSEDDEFTWVDLGAPGGSRVAGRSAGEHDLHTGDRIDLGQHTLTFYRDAAADHIRPEGGREGGELSGHPGEG